MPRYYLALYERLEGQEVAVDAVDWYAAILKEKSCTRTHQFTSVDIMDEEQHAARAARALQEDPD